MINHVQLKHIILLNYDYTRATLNASIVAASGVYKSLGLVLA